MNEKVMDIKFWNVEWRAIQLPPTEYGIEPAGFHKPQ